MKRHFIGIFILFAFFVSCSTTKNSNPESQQTVQKVAEKIQAKDYIIEINQAIPLRGRTINLNYGYDLKIKNDSAIAYLPYFGVATSAPYGGGEGGIKFAEPMEKYQLTPNKKNDGWEIRFNVKTKDHNYQFFLSVFNNGNSSVNVNSYEQDPISFYGNLK